MNDFAQSTIASRSVSAGSAVNWASGAWALFMRAPVMWIVMAVLMAVIWIVLSMVPIIGQLALPLVVPVFIGSWLLTARKVESGALPEIGDLFAGFQEKLTPLMIIGLIVLGASVAVGIVASVLGMGAVFGGLLTAGVDGGLGMLAGMGLGLVAMILAALAFFVISMAVWFAPALVVFHDMAPVEAVKASFAASLKNIGAFIVFWVLYLVAATIATIPMGLGWLVLIPVMMLVAWTSYRAVFSADPNAVDANPVVHAG